MMGVSKLLALGAALLLVGCAPVVEPDRPSLLEVGRPAALDSCTTLPSDLDAELWVSGQEESCELTPGDDGAVSGTCTIPGRALRTLHLDWFTTRQQGGQTVRVLLAQAKEVIDLREGTESERTVSFSNAVTRGCVDVTGADKVTGAATVSFAGAEVEPCDLDADCPDATSEACSNLGELCEGGDPLVP